MNSIHEREKTEREDDLRALNADELTRIEGGLGLGDLVNLVRQAAEVVRSIGRPTV